MMPRKIYVLYDGEENVCDGTIYEIAQKTGMSLKTLRWYQAPSTKCSKKHLKKSLIRLEAENFDKE